MSLSNPTQYLINFKIVIKLFQAHDVMEVSIS